MSSFSSDFSAPLKDFIFRWELYLTITTTAYYSSFMPILNSEVYDYKKYTPNNLGVYLEIIFSL